METGTAKDRSPGCIINRCKGINEIMSNHRVSLGFRRLCDADLDGFAYNIIICLTGNPAFPNPPVKLVDLEAMQTAFRAALAVAAGGGLRATVAKNQARQTLLDALRRTAGYVQLVAGQDPVMLLSSGFRAMSKNQAQSPLAVPRICFIANVATTQMLLRVTPIRNARSYQVRIKNGDGDWQAAGDFSQARQMVVKGLTPGTVYTFQVRAVGGSTGYSDWSLSVSQMAT